MAIRAILGLLLVGWACSQWAGSASAQSPVVIDDPFATPEPIDSPSEAEYFDLDAYLADEPPLAPRCPPSAAPEPYTLQVLPTGLIYKSYLAGPKEPRLSGTIVDMQDDYNNTVWNSTVGGRVGLLRYGSLDRFQPQGFQVDVEGAAFVRLDTEENVDVRSVDFRGGIPLTWGYGPHQTKLGYYHLSSHLGDEFLLKNDGFDRLNYSRDVLLLGHSTYVTPRLRLYGEVGWAFYTDISEPWELQFGFDYAPRFYTTWRGEPFVAANVYLHEEVDFGGQFTFQTGWAWRGDHNQRLLRIGLQYMNGQSSQFSFYDEFEEQIGFGAWYDY